MFSILYKNEIIKSFHTNYYSGEDGNAEASPQKLKHSAPSDINTPPPPKRKKIPESTPPTKETDTTPPPAPHPEEQSPETQDMMDAFARFCHINCWQFMLPHGCVTKSDNTMNCREFVWKKMHWHIRKPFEHRICVHSLFNQISKRVPKVYSISVIDFEVCLRSERHAPFSICTNNQSSSRCRISRTLRISRFIKEWFIFPWRVVDKTRDCLSTPRV